MLGNAVGIGVSEHLGRKRLWERRTKGRVIHRFCAIYASEKAARTIRAAGVFYLPHRHANRT